ncbi:hypothetical protein [uncultured Kriegella sp.]|uniref:hypothetical protein n=1 Tax=uncultured Kriegella sp. TaxID=1798910 RepID=UPI0030DA3771|tara:strand:+ start:181276 stop:182841 length:1566 start_codon:yes stop_codon:yes gene_type:complete
MKVQIKYLVVTFFAFNLTIWAKPEMEIRSWQLHKLDMDYCKKVMDEASKYDINTIVFSHEMIWTTMQLYGTGARKTEKNGVGEKLRELAKYAHDKDLKVWIWTHELADVPAKYLKEGIVQMDAPGFWKWLEDRYAKMFLDFPEFDGLMMTFHETQYKIFDNSEVASKLSMPDRFQKLINSIYKSCKKNKKELIVRTFVYEPEQLEWLKQGLDNVSDDIMVQSKCIPHDWEPFYPHNPLIGAFRNKKQIVEFDCSSEYTGRNHIPYTSPEYFSYRWKYDMTFPKVVGYNARLDHAGFDALFTPNEINIYTLAKITQNPEMSPDEIWVNWAKERYGQGASKGIIDVLKPSFDIVNKLFFPQGVWFTRHSWLPAFDYADSHISYINKWYKEEYIDVTEELTNPNMETFSQVREEKDEAIRLIQKSLWQLLSVKGKIKEKEYNDLQERFTLLLQTGLIWKSHITAFMGLKLLKSHPELKPIVKGAINNIQQLAYNIPDKQVYKPVADRDEILKISKGFEKLLSKY